MTWKLSSESIEKYVSLFVPIIENRKTEQLFVTLRPIIESFFLTKQDIALLTDVFNLVKWSNCFEIEYLNEIESYYHSFIEQIYDHWVIKQNFERQNNQGVFNALKCDLLELRDRKQLVNILADNLVSIGITKLAIVLFEDENQSKLEGGYSFENDTLSFFESNDLFSRKKMIPSSFKHIFTDDVFVVQPLFVEKQPLGYFICNVSSNDIGMYEDLRSALSSAYKSLLLFEETLLAKQQAEQAEKAKTAFFANIGSDLKEPVEEMLDQVESWEKYIEHNNDSLNLNKILTELNNLKSKLQKQVQQTSFVIDLTLSEVNDLVFDTELFNVKELVSEYSTGKQEITKIQQKTFP